jgi:hypothetical protein
MPKSFNLSVSFSHEATGQTELTGYEYDFQPEPIPSRVKTQVLRSRLRARMLPMVLLAEIDDRDDPFRINPHPRNVDEATRTWKGKNLFILGCTPELSQMPYRRQRPPSALRSAQ